MLVPWLGARAALAFITFRDIQSGLEYSAPLYILISLYRIGIKNIYIYCVYLLSAPTIFSIDNYFHISPFIEIALLFDDDFWKFCFLVAAPHSHTLDQIVIAQIN